MSSNCPPGNGRRTHQFSENKGTIVMWPFRNPKALAVKNRILELIGETSSGLANRTEGRRIDSRIKRVVVGIVVPIEDRRLQTDRAFTVLTKDFSSAGVAIVVNQPGGPEQAILGFRLEAAMTFFRAESRHMEPMGGGFFQIGYQLFEVVSARDYPELTSLSI
jgi:hypothetical protein